MSPSEQSRFAPREGAEGDPVFDEPWQAQVLAIAFRLAEQNVFSPAQWSQTLGAELSAAAAAGKPDNPDTYYHAALAALESLAGSHGGVSEEILDDRTEAWRRAYQNTPHGNPVKLEAGLKR